MVIEEVSGPIEDAYIIVLDHYVSCSPGYAGKVMIVIRDTHPSETEVYIWDRLKGIQPVEIAKR